MVCELGVAGTRAFVLGVAPPLFPYDTSVFGVANFAARGVMPIVKEGSQDGSTVVNRVHTGIY